MAFLLDFIFLLLLAALHLLLSVPVHESGHLALGLATGYRFVSFNVLGFVLARGEDGRLRISRSKNSLIAGQCLLAPPEDEADFRYGWYNAGGGLFNLLLVAPLLALYILAGAGYLGAFLLTGAAVNLMMGLVNLVPMSLGVPNDGLNLVTAARSPLARRGLYLMLRVNGEVQAGKRYRDYSAEDFAAPVPTGTRNYFEAYLLMLQSARLADMGEIGASAAVYDDLDLGRLNSYYATVVRINQMYTYCVYAGRLQEARALYADRRVQRLLQNPVPAMLRTRAAVAYFLLGQRDAAQTLMEQARTALEGQPSLGLRAMELDYLEELAEMMDAAEQNSLDSEGGDWV